MPLSVTLAGLAAVAPAVATTRFVNSCADSGPGTLRDQIAAAVAAVGNGDVIDLDTQLTGCSVITLGSQISFNIDLTLLGPSSRQLTISGTGASRLLQHTATGTLTIENLTLTGGYVYNKFGDAAGGCIMSSGEVALVSSTVSGCSVSSLGGTAFGGGVYAKSAASLDHATISGNSAHSVASWARGGGLAVTSNAVTVSYSTISGNAAVSDSATYFGVGGGVYAKGGGATLGTTEIYRSTVDSNSARSGAGIYLLGYAYDVLKISESTISGNDATVGGGGAWVQAFYLNVQNSTIAFNLAQTTAGLYARTVDTSISSSIVAQNLDSAGGFADLFQFSSGSWVGTSSLLNSYNVAPTNGSATIVHGDPQLVPLAFHGGPTRTHALLATSPAIDNGSNAQNLATDQRGSGFPREVPSGKPDIGAYERQASDDELFANGFQ